MSEEPSVDESPVDVPLAKKLLTRVSVWWMALATLLFVASFVGIEPLMHWLLHGPHDLLFKFGRPSWMAVVEQSTLEFITILWFFMLGGSFGSFLHCLEYRLPRGISIAAQGSSCPGCHTKIKAWHNVPLFGWIMLRGRCSACGWEIPVRYPLAELVFSFTFVILMAVELIGGGCNLPLNFASLRIGVSETIWFPRWNLIGYYVFHVTLMTFLLTWCLFAYDRFRVPVVLIIIAAIIGITCPLIWPRYYPLDLHGLFNAQNNLLRAALTEVTGIGVGLLLGFLVRRSFPLDFHAEVLQSENSATISSMALVGLYLGWQAALGIAILVVIFRLLAILLQSIWNLTLLPVVMWITLATLIHLLFWRMLIALPYWPGSPQLGLMGMGYPVLLMLAVEIERRQGEWVKG